VGRDPSPDSAMMTRPFVPASSAYSAMLCRLCASMLLAEYTDTQGFTDSV
jgi:hypothetical protein